MDGNEIDEVVSEGGDDVFETLIGAMEKCNEGDLEGALAICKRVITDNENCAEAFFVMAVIAFNLEDQGQAYDMAKMAHDLEPDTREYAQVLATISARIGRLTDAVYFAKLAHVTESDPRLAGIIPRAQLDFDSAMKSASPSKHGLEGESALNLGQNHLAFRKFSAELRINPTNPQALMGMAKSALATGRGLQAIGALQSLVRAEPDNINAYALLARALVVSGREVEGETIAYAAIARAEGDAEIYMQAMWALQHISYLDAASLKKIAAQFQEDFNSENTMDTIEPSTVAPDRPISIGFLSNGFYRSNVSEYIMSWFEMSPPTSYEVTGYHMSVMSDGVTASIMQGCNNWQKVINVDPWTLALSVGADNVDVLVDVSHPDMSTNSTLLGLAPSPVRVGVSALPEPSLMPGVTHVLSDEVLAEADKNMLLDGQDMIVVTGTLFARPPFSNPPKSDVAPISENGHATFGAIAKLPNVSPEWAEMVSRVLRGVEKAKLLLFVPGTLSDQDRSKIREYFLNCGVVDRMFFASQDEDAEEMMVNSEAGRRQIPESYWQAIDVLLDTSPINYHREIFEALWNGVPTITLRGARRISSVGASIVAAANRPNWIARNPAQFVELASDLAHDVEHLQAERIALIKSIADAPLFDFQNSSRRIRTALQKAGAQSRKIADVQ
tara:strand:- start:25894 stop:27906 length:2013 start_codon:yes stop_codon:yes gene_type:complete